MKSLARIRRPLVLISAIVLMPLIGAFSDSALQTAKPSILSTPPANLRAGTTNLTPTAPMSALAPASSQADIRDIRQPRHLPRPWAAVAVGVFILSAAAFTVWRLGRRSKSLQMLPHEIALHYLEEARQLMNPEHTREYCFAVSNIIRDYVEVRFEVEAPAMTTEEFLRDLVEVRDTMLESQRLLLREFLHHCDLAKFAGWRYSLTDLEEMHASARSFVQKTAVAPETGAPRVGQVQPAAGANPT